MMLPWPWAKFEWRAVCAERCTYGSGRRSASALLTPLPMRRGFLYLVAIIDWFTRKVLAWRISNHSRSRLLRRSVERGGPQVRQPGDHEHRSGIAVHVLCMDGPVAADGRTHLYGRQRAVPRQHLCRAAVAHAQIRVRLPARLGNRITGPGRYPQVDGLLQSETPTHRPWRQAACHDLLAGNRPTPTRSAGAESSLIYAENCPISGE